MTCGSVYADFGEVRWEEKDTRINTVRVHRLTAAERNNHKIVSCYNGDTPKMLKEH